MGQSLAALVLGAVKLDQEAGDGGAGRPSARITFAARQVGAAARSSIPACAQPSAAATMAKVLPVPASPITTATPSGP